MPSVMDRRPMPRSASSAARSTSPFIVLPRRSSFHTTSTSPSRACDNASAKPVRFALAPDAMPLEQNRVEPARGPAGIAFPPSMESLMPVGERRAMRIEQAKDQISRYLPTAHTVASRQYEPLNRIADTRSEEHTSELQYLMSISYAVLRMQTLTIKQTYLTHHTNKHIHQQTSPP